MIQLVKLAKTNDPIRHKQPIERNWPELHPSISEIKEHIKSGGGVGIKVNFPLCVMDIDGGIDDPRIKSIIDRALESGCLVIKSLKGYHIFFNYNSTFPEKDKKFIYDPEKNINIEYYCGSSPRMIVLPISKTPRYELGSRILNKNVNHNLESIISYLEQLNDNFQLPLELYFYLDPEDFRDNHKSHRERILLPYAKMLDLNSIEELKTLNPELIIEKMRNTPPGMRNNMYRDLGNLLFAIDPKKIYYEKFRAAALEAWKDELSDEKKANHVYREMQHLDKTREEPATWLRHYIFGTSKPGSENDIEELNDILFSIFGEEEKNVRIVEYYTNKYILFKNYAYDLESFDTLLFNYGKILSERKINILFKYTLEHYPLIDSDSICILGTAPTIFNNKVILAVLYSGDIKLIVYDGSTLEMCDSIHGVYIIKSLTHNYRDITMFWNKYIKHLSPEERINYVRELYFERVKLFVGEKYYKQLGCLFANFITGNATGGILITGNSGSGKTALSHFLQHIAQGSSREFISTSHKDILPILYNARLVGIDEKTEIDKDLQALIKSYLTFGTINTRKLHSNLGLISIKLNMSIIFSATDINKLEEDLLRRCVLIDKNIFSTPGRKIPENELNRAFSIIKITAILGAMTLIKLNNNDVINDVMDDINILLGENKDYTSYPAWVLNSSKKDIAEGYYDSCKLIGLNDYEIEAVWNVIRRESLIRMISNIWGTILEVYNTDEKFREMMHNSLSGREIYDYIVNNHPRYKLEEYYRNSRNHIVSFLNHLKSSARKIGETFKEMGYELIISKKPNDRNTNLFQLRRLDSKKNNILDL